MVNKSQQCEDDRNLHCTWSTDIPYLRLYHILIEDSILLSLGQAFATKTREQLNGQNSNLFKSFYERLLIGLMMRIGFQTVLSYQICMKISIDQDLYL